MKKLVSLILCLAMILAWLPVGGPSAAAADPSSDIPDDMAMGVKISDQKLFKRRGYEVTFLLSNTTPWERDVTLYAAVYTQDGKMVSVVSRQEILGAGDSYTVTMPLPVEKIAEWGIVRIFCLNSSTKKPYCSRLGLNGFHAQVIQELDYITVEPAFIEGQVGESVRFPTVTAHYINGKEDREISASQASISVSGDEGVVTVRQTGDRAELVFGHTGSATLTITYTEGGISKSVQVPVTVFEPLRNLGFLADPDAEPLPADAIPISNAEELAALGDTKDGSDTVGKTYYLANDITLTGYWDPIPRFRGTLDGRGHKIIGLKTSPSTYPKRQKAGLVGIAKNAVFKNLAVEVEIGEGVRAPLKGGFCRVGGLVGTASHVAISDSFSQGKVKVTADTDGSKAPMVAGGLVGNASECTISRCYASGSISAYGSIFGIRTAYIGGLYGLPAASSVAVDSYRVKQEISGNGNYRPEYNYAGTELTCGQAGDAGSYSGFDFTNTWTITDTAWGLPHLQYQD